MEKNKLKLYVSLPITGRCLKDVKVYAKRVKLKWEANGYDVVTPFEAAPVDGMPYAYYMGRDVEALLGCDGIVLCPDWFSSRGCRLEYNVAEIYKKKVFIMEGMSMARMVKYKLNKHGLSTTRCPNGFTTFVGNRPKMAGGDCMFCKYREHIDFDNHVVKCSYGKKDSKVG